MQLGNAKPAHPSFEAWTLPAEDARAVQGAGVLGLHAATSATTPKETA
jgi:hypothetical protein